MATDLGLNSGSSELKSPGLAVEPGTAGFDRDLFMSVFKYAHSGVGGQGFTESMLPLSLVQRCPNPGFASLLALARTLQKLRA